MFKDGAIRQITALVELHEPPQNIFVCQVYRRDIQLSQQRMELFLNGCSRRSHLQALAVNLDADCRSTQDVELWLR